MARRPERRTIVVFREGKASEPDYINGLIRLPQIKDNTSVGVEIDPGHGTPLTLVERAVERKKSDPKVDELWCVFDVEWPTSKRHPYMDRARQIAAAHGIHLAISNPCFELWLVLHFKDQHAFLDTDAAERLSRKLDGRKNKRIDADQYMSRREAACGRAASLDGKHRRDLTEFPDDNPSSSMHEFLRMLECDRE